MNKRMNLLMFYLSIVNFASAIIVNSAYADLKNGQPTCTELVNFLLRKYNYGDSEKELNKKTYVRKYDVNDFLKGIKIAENSIPVKPLQDDNKPIDTKLKAEYKKLYDAFIKTFEEDNVDDNKLHLLREEAEAARTLGLTATSINLNAEITKIKKKQKELLDARSTTIDKIDSFLESHNLLTNNTGCRLPDTVFGCELMRPPVKSVRDFFLETDEYADSIDIKKALPHVPSISLIPLSKDAQATVYSQRKRKDELSKIFNQIWENRSESENFLNRRAMLQGLLVSKTPGIVKSEVRLELAKNESQKPKKMSDAQLAMIDEEYRSIQFHNSLVVFHGPTGIERVHDASNYNPFSVSCVNDIVLPDKTDTPRVFPDNYGLIVSEMIAKRKPLPQPSGKRTW